MGVSGTIKSSVDLAEVIECKDRVYAVVSVVGVSADVLQISFISNVTSVVTMPISMGCKVFVWSCKKYKLYCYSC